MEAAVPLMATAADYEVTASQQQSDTFLILSLVTVVSSAVFLLRWTRRQGRPPLPPGPLGLPLLGSVLSLEPDLHRYFASLARAYGLRLGTRLSVVLSSPAAVREALKDHDVIFANHDPPAVTTAITRAEHTLVWSPHGTYSLAHAPLGDRAGVHQRRRQRGGPLAAACHRSPSCPRGEPVEV
ncbi:unnamed protein product [Musa textilis]